MADCDELINRFRHHPPGTPERADEHKRVRELCLELALEMTKIVPPGREQALALTHLENTMFWANAGIARQK